MKMLLTTFAILAVATPAVAGNSNELTVGGAMRSLHSDSANAVTADNLGGVELEYARKLDLQLPRLATYLTGSWQAGSADGTMFKTLDTAVRSNTLLVGLRAMYAIHPQLWVHARAELGMAHASLTLTDYDQHELSDGGWGAASSIAIGGDIYAVARPQFTFGVRFEYGYLKAQGVELSPRANRSGDDTVIMLPTTDTSLGKLNLSGQLITISAVAQF